MRALKPFLASFFVIFSLLIFNACGIKSNAKISNSSTQNVNSQDINSNENTNLNFTKSPISSKNSNQTQVLTSSNKLGANPLGFAFGDINDADSLRLGKTPTPPTNDFKNPKPVDSVSKITEETFKFASQEDVLKFNQPFFTKPALSNNAPTLLNETQKADEALPKVEIAGIPPDLYERTSDYMVIMAANGVVITIWARAPGNWLWAYALSESADLGNYRAWRLIFLPENEVMVINLASRTTCMGPYGNGLIHTNCDITNLYQRFTLRPMSNGAVQFYNKMTNKCVQTPLDDVFFGDDFGALNLVECADDLDQQWYFLPSVQNSALYEVDN